MRPKKVAILTAGGLAPCLSAALGGLIERYTEIASDIELICYRGGYKGLRDPWLLIGKKTDEAVELTDKFLDEAFLNGLSEVRVIHGHGTGALRRAIVELLEGHPHVARFSPASQDKGGAGATVVQLNS